MTVTHSTNVDAVPAGTIAVELLDATTALFLLRHDHHARSTLSRWLSPIGAGSRGASGSRSALR